MNKRKKIEVIKESFYNLEMQYEESIKYAYKILEIIPKRLYKYRIRNEQNIEILKEKKAWFSNSSTWNDQLNATVLYDIEKGIEYINNNIREITTKLSLS